MEPVESPVPTRTRFVVLGVLCLLSGILYLDRICISAALDSIQKDLKLSNTEISYVLMAFTLAYGLYEVPTGRWGDRLGARRVLTRITLWWSVFTALTGASIGFWTLVPIRFLFGAGEAGAFPNVARVMARWFPDHERGRAQGILLAASQVGGAVAPFLAAVMIQGIGWRRTSAVFGNVEASQVGGAVTPFLAAVMAQGIGWRWTFAAFGSVGLLWAACFYWWFRDEPASHPGVNAAEVQHIGKGAAAGDVHTAIPWSAVLRNPSVWLLSIIMILASFNSYIYFSWFPKYLKSGRGVELTEAGLMASLVLAGAACGTFAGGQMLDRLVLRGGMVRRRLFGAGCFFVAAATLGLALLTSNPWLAASFTALSCFATQGTQPLWWSCTIGISGKHVGALFGLMNSAGVVGAMGSQYLVGALADWLGAQGLSGRAQWDPIFYINMGVLVTAGLFWAAFVMQPVEGHKLE
jgi:sugar phosphate permease